MNRFVFPLVSLLCIGSLSSRAADSGEAVYKQRCAACHDQGGERIPPRAALERLPASRILRAMDSGVMMTVAYPLGRGEREAVAAYLGKAGPEPGPRAAAFCSDRSVKISNSPKFAWNGWSPTPDNARFQSAAMAGLTIGQVGHLKLKWAYAFEGDIAAWAQPTVIDGQVFVGSAGGVVQALRGDTGCLQWTFQASGPVRSAISAVPLNSGHVLLFSDIVGWFYALQAETGKLLWKKRVEEHEAARPTGAALVHDGIAYVPVASWEETRSLNPEYACCTFRGSVSALRIRDGSTVWKTYTIAEVPKQNGKNSIGTARFGPSGAGVWSTPTLDLKRRRIYVTTGDNYSDPATKTSDAVMALDMATGKILWSKQTVAGDAYTSACGVKGVNCPDSKGPDYDFGSSAILAKTAGGRELLLAGQKSGMVYALDPDHNGEVVWQTRVGKGGTIGGVQWGMASDGQRVYAAASDAHFVTGKMARTLDPSQGGGLTALRIADGSKAWYVPPVPCGANQQGCSPAQSAAVTAIPGVVFSGSMDGHLRAYAAEDGKVLWDFDTARAYQTVNGIAGHGGTLDGPGPVVVNGMVFVNSGYPRFGGMPGNVLLAFAPDGQ
ncbi:MAG TPA: PQQ-binding-like beta-propeller repeat protein [Bryobacteraceae bacterium]|nr:PQQ-binding-like beta-propeller repeat protein [Bryobacteraceae bacterium]